MPISCFYSFQIQTTVKSADRPRPERDLGRAAQRLLLAAIWNRPYAALAIMDGPAIIGRSFHRYLSEEGR